MKFNKFIERMLIRNVISKKFEFFRLFTINLIFIKQKIEKMNRKKLIAKLILKI